MPSIEPDRHPSDTTSHAQARLRMVRVHAEQALGERDRRDGGPAQAPIHRDASSIAREQLRHVPEVHGDVAEPLVIDVPALRDCSDDQAQPIRTFAERILQQRRVRETREKVFFRHEDIETLSGLLQCPSDDVTPLLGRLGLLA